jgi:hypothetical protein
MPALWTGLERATGGAGVRCERCAELEAKIAELTLNLSNQQFWGKVDKSGDCWVWTGFMNGAGYGLYDPIGRQRRLTHRYSWELHNGSIPKGMHVLHRCDNPPCVNPDHLWLGTHQQNMEDKAKKGRCRRGKGNHHSKLTVEKVLEIRAMRAAGATIKELRALFGLSSGGVTGVIYRKSWRYLPDEQGGVSTK